MVLIAILGIFCYSNTLAVPFQFDDAQNIVENPIVKDSSYFADTGRAAGLERYNVLRARYVGYLTFFLNYHAGGLDVAGYHLVNILIHLINALLVYALVMLSFQTPVLCTSNLFDKRHFVSLLAASLFVAHPVNTQAVTYIVQRLASLAALFYLGSMVCYIKSRLSEGKSRWLYYALALVFAVLAMKTKEIAFTLPLAIALYEVMFFRGGSKKKRALLLVPFLLTMLIIPLTLVDLGKPTTQVMTDISEKTGIQHISRGEYLMTELRVMGTYLRLLALPVNQSIDYDYPMYMSITQAPVLGGLALVAMLLGLAGWLYRRREPAAKLASFGIVFFFLALSVESTLVPLFPIFEHRLYLPGTGIFLAMSSGLMMVYVKLKSNRTRNAAIAAAAILSVVLACFTYARNGIWKSEVSLWQDAQRSAPNKFRVLGNLGKAYFRSGQYSDAIDKLNEAIRLPHAGPEPEKAYNILGLSYLRRSEFKNAYDSLMKAASLNPEYGNTFSNLATFYGERGDYSSALRASKKAVELDPLNWVAYSNLGLAHASLGQQNLAVAAYKKSLTLNPYYVEARFNLALTYLALGEQQLALKEYTEIRKQNEKYADRLLAEIEKAKRP